MTDDSRRRDRAVPGGPGIGLMVALVIVVIMLLLVWFMFTRSGTDAEVTPDELSEVYVPFQDGAGV